MPAQLVLSEQAYTDSAIWGDDVCNDIVSVVDVGGTGVGVGVCT